MSNPYQSPEGSPGGPNDHVVWSGRRFWRKLIIFAAVLGIGFVAYFLFGESLTLKNLAQQESKLRGYQQDFPILVYATAFLIYVSVTGLSLPGAAAMSLVLGWFFGFQRGTILVSFASTTGATLAFLLSRYLLRDWVQHRFGDYLSTFNKALEREGAFYLFTLRLIPYVPFFAINLVMGLTPVRTRTFWWVSQLGMLPGTCVYLYAGASIPNLQTLAEQGVGGILTPSILVAFTLLGVFPILVKKIVERFRPIDESD